MGIELPYIGLYRLHLGASNYRTAYPQQDKLYYYAVFVIKGSKTMYGITLKTASLNLPASRHVGYCFYRVLSPAVHTRQLILC